MSRLRSDFSLRGESSDLAYRVGNMDYAGGVAALGLMCRLFASVPRPTPPCPWRHRNYFAYVVPTSQEIAPAVETS